MHQKPGNLFAFLILLIVLTSCSTKKNTLLTRTYHQVTARYNTYFNGRESFNAGVRKSEQQFQFDYNRILPVFLYTDPSIANTVGPEMDRAIDKASKVITNKSITAKPGERGGLFGRRNDDFYNQNEYNRWVKESYLLAGKAHFYKHDFLPAAQAFLFMIREYSTSSVRHEAKVWLARSYSERGRFSEARMLLDEMLEDREFPAGLNGELYSTIADFHLKQDEFENALLNLEKAIRLVDDKDAQIRYAFILAQLYEQTGDFPTSSDYYARVVKMNPPYEMVFNALISQAGVFQPGSQGRDKMINDFEKMLRDDKNRDYHDQIYYALGNFYLRNEDEANAINMYQRSAGAEGVNPSQKTVTYLALAEIYLSYPDYLMGAAYYDSAFLSMDQNYPERNALAERNSILKELAGNIKTFELEDSVQLLASLSETERTLKIDEVIAQVKKEEADARQREQLAQQTGRSGSARNAQAARYQAERTGGGNWYFYNQSAVTFGQNEFESLWGSRRLEDNWRRSSKQVLNSLQFADAGEEEIENGDSLQQISDTGSRDYYMRNIPLTTQDLQTSHKRLQEALLGMAEIYRDQLNDYDRSAEAYEELVRRYPGSENNLSALYEIYSLHNRQQNHQEAERYKKLIVSEYPGSPYAAILTNPEYFNEYRQQISMVENYYEETFDLFKANEFQKVAERASFAMENWPDNELIPRFEYLQILSSGAGGNIPLFQDMLAGYIEKYPDTEMAENAGEFITYLENDYPDIILETEVAVIQDIYHAGQEGSHYFVVVVENKQDLINRMVFNIVNFNVDNFARLNLNVSTEAFSNNYRLMRVDGLPDTSSAIDYLNRFVASEEVLAEAGDQDFPVFVISPGNYELFMKDKNIGSYLNYFNGEYMNR